jgi:hypothetical protein
VTMNYCCCCLLLIAATIQHEHTRYDYGYLPLSLSERLRESAGRRAMDVVRHRRPDPPLSTNLVRKWLASAHFLLTLYIISLHGAYM